MLVPSQERKERTALGNSAWGHGYHQGSKDGFSSGFGQGAGVGAAVTVVVGGFVAVGRWGYQEIKKRQVAKHEQRLLAEGEQPGSGEDSVSEDDRDQ